MTIEFMYEEIDISQGLLVSGIVLIILGVYYLYKKKNRIIITVIGYLTRPHRAQLKKDTRTQDWLLFIVMLAVIVIFGIKAIIFMVVISDSMRPEFHRGDMIVSQSVFMTIEKGDIITFKVQNQHTAVSHRVVGIENGYIITKGDNSPLPDGYRTTQKDVMAKAIQINNHPIVIKNLGALFITDYSKEGVIYKFGDRFTFLQQLSATIKAWGLIITIIAILAYILTMVGDKKYGRN